jgi:hypothetical protein
VTLGLATSAVPAGVDLTPDPCATRSSGRVFSPWLDLAQYFRAPNGGFELGEQDWSLDGDARIVAGNEPYRIGGPADASSLALGPGAVVRSDPTCVQMLEPTVRLFVRTPPVFGARLTVTATVRNPATGVALSTSWVVVGGLTAPTWAPTPPLLVPNLLGGLLDQELTLQFRTGGTPATWVVDDVYVDPIKHR